MIPKLHIYKNEKETCMAFAEWVAEHISEKLTQQEKFTIALSGGDTPKQLYKILAADYIDKIDWKKVHVFWGDERSLKSAEEKSNARVAGKTFIEQVGIPHDQVHIIPTDLTPEECAKQYEIILKEYFKDLDQTFDLAILGLSEDGTILSLFPGNEENTTTESWVIPVVIAPEEPFRITLTIPVVNSAVVKAFLITGKRKEDIVQQVLNGKYLPERYPAQLIHTAGNTVHWFIDESAAGKIIKPATT